MKKFYIIIIFCLLSSTAKTQTTKIYFNDWSDKEGDFSTTFNGETVIDVYTTASTIASPLLSCSNPFKDVDFDEATLSFNIYNYGTEAFLGALFSFYDSNLGRLYFSNGSYLGYNANNEWFDANLIKETDAYYPAMDYLELNTWKSVEFNFSSTGYRLLIDGTLAYSNESTGDVFDAGTLTDISNVMTFLQNATWFVLGTGSWWSDNINVETGLHWDAQNSYIKNLAFTYSKNTISTAIENSTEEGKIISTDYYDIRGNLIKSDYESLKAGIYIKKTTYNTGFIKSTKIVKTAY